MDSSGRVPSVTSNDDNAFLEWTQARYITVVLSVHDRLRACIALTSWTRSRERTRGASREMSGAGAIEAQPWQLYVKDLVGTTTTVSVRDPQVRCVNSTRALRNCMFSTPDCSIFIPPVWTHAGLDCSRVEAAHSRAETRSPTVQTKACLS